MDEYISPVPIGDGVVKSAPAEAVLDQADQKMGGHGDLVFKWLSFRVNSSSDSRTLSRYLIRGQLPKLLSRTESFAGQCYALADRFMSGKSAVRCDVGLGFTIHSPVIIRPGKGITRGLNRHPTLRTWHARLRHANSKCDYIPPSNDITP